MVAEGSYICDAQIQRSVIGIRSVIGPGAKIFNSVVMGADYYETPADIERNQVRSVPNVGIGSNSSIIVQSSIKMRASVSEGLLATTKM